MEHCVWLMPLILLVMGAWLPLASAGDYGDDIYQLREYYRSLSKAGCPDPPPNITDGPTMPTVPKSFMTNLEIQMIEDSLNSKKVMYGSEGYDNDKLRGILNYRTLEGMVQDRPLLMEQEIHYDIGLDESLFVYGNIACDVAGDDNCVPERECHAKKLQDVSIELQQLFGFVSNSDGDGFAGASGILEFGPQFGYWPEKDAQPCRGMDCHVFTTCLEKPEENATVWYKYYWTTPEWNVQNNGKQVPVRVEIYGQGQWEGQFIRNVTETIEFFDYKRWVKPGRDLLEQPADVYCWGKIDTIKPPTIKDYFWYKSETVMGFTLNIPDGSTNYTQIVEAKGVFPRDEYYDFIARITRVDYTPFFLYGSDRRFEHRTTRIHDFNQGLSYLIRPVEQFCNVTKIENFTSWGDVVVEPDGSVHMAMPINFEDMDMDYHYNGIHLVRGLEAGVWAGVKPNPLLEKNETYIWYFASPLTNDWQGFESQDRLKPLPTLDHVPFKLEKYLTGHNVHPHQVINFFNYESNIPHLNVHDISVCYTDSQMKSFRLDLPDDALNKTFYQKEHLVYWTQGAIAGIAKVSPLRINRMELQISLPRISVIFTILGHPKNHAGLNHESTIAQAEKRIRTALDNSQLIIEVKIGKPEDKPIILVAKPNTMHSISRLDEVTKGIEVLSGYSSGDMAGLGIGMVILGGILGFVGLFFFNSKR